MKLTFNSKLNFGLTVSTSVALIIIGAMLVKYKIDPAGSLFYLVGIVIALIGFISLLNFVAHRKKDAKVLDYVFSIFLVIFGILIAIFSEPLQGYGMLLIGILLIALAVFDFTLFARQRNTITLVVGVLRFLIGVAFIASGVSEAFAQNNDFASKLWVIIGYGSIVLGITFLVLDTFIEVE
ncbi:MAG: DUF308 domain-containing protein [Bacilli bacterium]|nr:DUF308 domain-containing protein [Bacilli bacterium]